MKKIYFLLLSSIFFLHSYPQGIQGRIVDAETKKPLAARIVIIDDTGHVYNSYYTKLAGFFTDENGTFSQQLKSGNYSVEVFHGIDYVSQKFTIEITNNTIDTVIALQSWYPLKNEGWYNGDGHDHLYTDNKPDTAMMRLVRKICIAQGVDFMFTAQGWSGFNDSTWKEGYANYSDEKFHVFYGSEMPKYRTGHTWWMGQQTTHGLFESTMDTTYENQYYQSAKGTEWNFETLRFPQIPDVEMVKRLKQSDGSLAIAAHPTSWWMQKRVDIEKYVTNVACNLSFGLLAGKIWDGIVAMGYDHDHYFYQNLWFNILNAGYRMPAFSELDGGLGKDDKFYYGSMRTYFHIDGDFSVAKIIAAAKKGNSFLTSGPIIMADINNRFKPGDNFYQNANKHVLHITAYASGERDDYLSYVVVFRKGKIFKVWDIRKEKQRKFSDSIAIDEKGKSWYIVKAYGRRAWSDPKYLDVMGVCEKKEPVETVNGELDVAFTNPFYFTPPDKKHSTILHSTIHLKLPVAKSGTIAILDAGKKIRTVKIKSGTANFTMPINCVLKITVTGYKPVYRSLYLDYLPHRDLIEKLASGKWRNDYSVKYNPGEVPWSAFSFDKTKSVLSAVNWDIDLKQNERDALYSTLVIE